jgi:protocatechuate 3,4-dioxygenase beta subunit
MNRRVLGVIIGVAVIGIAAVLYVVCGTPAHPRGATSGSASASAGHVRTGAAATGARSSIRGRVMDRKGPVAGASVCAATRGDLQTCTTTDAEGAYVIENLSAIAYRVTALAAQHRPATFGIGTPAGSWLVLGVGETRDKIDLVLRAGVLLSGVVQDINAGPIAGAKVRVQTAGGFDILGETRRFWSPPVVSETDGAFQLWVEPGRVEVMAVADGYGESRVEAEAPTSVVVLLTPEGSIAGTVVDPRGQPVAGATVVARSLDMTRETLTAADGTFTLDHLEASQFEVTARTTNGFGAASGDVSVSLGTQTTVKIQLLAASRLSGVVMLGDKPCPEPRVDVRDPRTELERSMIDDGHGGSVHIDGLLPGEYVVHPQCPGGYESPAPYARVVVTEKDQDGLVWHVNPGASIHGRVTNETGAPVADAEVEAAGDWSESDRTDDDGRYEITGLRAGTYTITATALDGGHSEAKLTLADAEARSLDLNVQASARIAGTLVDAAGRPVSGLEIRADPKEQERSRGTSLSAPEVSSSGTFDIPVLAGAYHVYAAVDWSHPIAPGVDVTVAAGQRVNVQIKVPAQDGVIKGKVVDESGGAVTDAVVTASVPSGFFDDGFTLGWNEHPVLTAADGTFTLTGLGPDAYTVKASRPGAPIASQKGVTPGSTVTLTIVTPTSIAGTVAYADGKHPREIVVAVRGDAFYRDERFLGTNGVFRLDQVASGRLALTVTDPDRGFVGLALTLAPGEAKHDLALVLRPMVEIHGRLIDGKTRQPLAGQIVLAEAADSVVHPGSFYDDFNHTTAADGTFRFMAPLGDITVSSHRFDVKNRERCEGSLHDTIDGPTDVGDLERTCKKM